MSLQYLKKQLSYEVHILYADKHFPSRLSPQWLCGNSCTWVHNVRFEPVWCLNEHSEPCIMKPKCMSYHKAIVVIYRRAHCFYNYIHIASILLLLDLSTLHVVDQEGFWTNRNITGFKKCHFEKIIDWHFNINA